MANTRNGNTIYLDAAGSIVANTRPTKVVYIMLTSAGAGDNLILRDTNGSGDLKISLKIKQKLMQKELFLWQKEKPHV